VSGNVRLDLYKGGTALANKIGTITTNTPAATGKYSWHVGKYIGGTAIAGEGYLVVISSYTPEMKDSSNGPFTITKGTLQAGVATASKGLSLTYPRRGDRWHKGTGYTIKWTSAGLMDAKIKLQLLAKDGQTVVMTIKENIDNNGQTFWAVPMSLPDAETFYKMRIQTMDNAHSDTVGPFPIVKANPPPGPPAIKVTAPGGPAQVSTGITYPIRWTSTCGTSANGPVDDAFTIDLMDATGSAKIMNLLDSNVASYDGENPSGIHNWHWDWPTSSTKAGKYRIRVTNLSGHCVGMSEQFQLVYSQEFEVYTIKTSIKNCTYIGPWCCASYVNPYDLSSHGLQLSTNIGGVDLARVGFYFHRKHDVETGYDLFENIILRSKLIPPDPYWYKDKGHVIYAKLTLQRQWHMDQPTYKPCLGGVVVLSKDATCVQNPDPNAQIASPPSMPGTVVPINASKGTMWEVDLTQQYQNIVQHNRPDYGLMLYPVLESSPGVAARRYQNAETYTVNLRFRFVKDIKP
jgi:hypothetical protein